MINLVKEFTREFNVITKVTIYAICIGIFFICISLFINVIVNAGDIKFNYKY